MVSFSSLVLAFSTVVGGLAAPSKTLSARTSLTSSGTGTVDGYYYSFWTDGGSQTMTLGDAGEYSVKWSGDDGNFVAGVGWETGSAQ